MYNSKIVDISMLNP